MSMKFQYVHDIPTVEQAMAQAVGHFVRSGHPSLQGVLDLAIVEVAEAALTEIRTIQTAELATLFDPEGTAKEFNEAIELAIKCVEGSL